MGLQWRWMIHPYPYTAANNQFSLTGSFNYLLHPIKSWEPYDHRAQAQPAFSLPLVSHLQYPRDKSKACNVLHTYFPPTHFEPLVESEAKPARLTTYTLALSLPVCGYTFFVVCATDAGYLKSGIASHRELILDLAH